MEFPELGEQCQQVRCNTVDFLPIICKYCSKTFCSHHFNAGTHSCDGVVTNEAIVDLEKQNRNPKCSFAECKHRDAVEMLCVKCKNHFCLQHRYHDCFQYSDTEIAEARRKLAQPRQEFAKSLAKVESETQERIDKCKKMAKTRETALKVQLMKLKGKALGESAVPAADRVYFLIFMPLRLNMKSKAIFVSKNWPIGKVIDNVSQLCKIPNRNNVPDSEKLRFFLKSSGNLLCSDMSKLLSDLMESNQIANGESLILEYGAPNVLDIAIAESDKYHD